MNAISDPAVPSIQGPDHASPAAITFAAAAALVPSWTGLSETRRRDMLSALNTAARMLALPLAAIPCDIAWLNQQRLFREPPAAFGMSRQRLRNVKWGLRAVLRELGLHTPPTRGEGGLPAEWTAVLEASRHEALRACLRGFARYCAERAVAPLAVSDVTLADYIAHDSRTRLSTGAASRGADVARAWNTAIGNAVDLRACHALKAPALKEPYTLPFDAYPQSFQAEIRQFEARMGRSTGASVFSTGESGARARPATVKTRLFAIRQAAAALVRQGHNPAKLTGLRDLVDPIENVGAILDFVHDRAAARLPPDQRLQARIVGGQLAVIAETLLIIGKHHVGLSGEPLRQLQIWRKAVNPRRRGLTPKVRERLRRLIELRTRSLLITLPEEILKAARHAEDVDIDLARRVMAATALEILLGCPLRMRNLTGLRLDRHLQRVGGGGRRRITHIVFDACEMKNGGALEWPVSQESSRLLEAWIRDWRPMLVAADPANPFLFPGRSEGTPVSQNALGDGLRTLIHREIGVRAHPHLMRHFAAWRHLNRRPGEYEIVRRALGHDLIETTIGTFCGLEVEAAARHFDAVLMEDRAQARRVAAAARLRRKPRFGR